MSRHGENIHKRRDGRWEARVRLGTTEEGKTRYKYLYGGSYREVWEKKRRFLGNPDPDPPDGSDRERPACLRDAALGWLAFKQLQVKLSTYDLYAMMVERHILPQLGDVPLQDLDSQRIQAFLLERKTHGRVRDGGALSDKTLFDLKSILKQILQYAHAGHMLEDVPECPPVSARPPAVSVLTRVEQEKLEEQVLKEDNPFTLGILVCLYTGVRIGEACALQWQDFDWDAGTLSVWRTLSRVSDRTGTSQAKSRVVLGTPKTSCSQRTIPLPEALVSYCRVRQGDPEDFLMTGTGHWMEPRVCRERFTRLLRRAGVEHHKFHALRHTYATRCVEEGVDVKTLSENLGHSDVKITLQRYVHPSMESKKIQVNKLGTILNRGHDPGK